MGMAASQARFLSLTARKNNTEYEGQQINQQRTTLSNQTANYYNDLLGMSVPVPPSVDNYTKTVYSFEDGSISNTISTMIAEANGYYNVSYTSSWVDDFAAVTAARSIVTKTDDAYYVGAKQLRGLDSGVSMYTEDASGNKTSYRYVYFEKDQEDADKQKATAAGVYLVDKNGKFVATIPEGLQIDSNDEYLKTLSSEQLLETIKQEHAYEQILNAQYGEPKEGWMVRYVENTTTGTWAPYFYKKDVLDSATYGENDNSLSNIPAYTIGSAEKTEEIKGVRAKIEQDATGRLINITLRPGEADEVTYALTTNTVTDQAAYDDAMNQYEYDKATYDHAIAEINAKIEIIQAEDKDLELRLKQLDTEQNAITNELDAVKKVIEKNVESSFKTFG